MTYTITSTTSGVSTTTIATVYDDDDMMYEGGTTLSNGSTVELQRSYDGLAYDLVQTLVTSDNVTLLSSVIVGEDQGIDSNWEAYSKAVALPDGGYAIAWTSTGGTGSALYLAIYDELGNQVGDEIVIASSSTGGTYNSDLTVGTDGTISVIWFDDNNTYYETLLNNGPQSNDFTADLSEDGSYTFSVADFDFTSSTNATLVSVKITSVPTSGSLLLNGVAVTADDVIAIDDVTKLVWTPDADANGDGLDGLEFKVVDSDDTLSATYSVTFDVAAVADLPTAENNTVTLDEDGSYGFAASDFGFADVDSNTLASITITALPMAGTLTFNGIAVVADAVIDAADISALVWTPDANANGDALASLEFKVTDSDGDTSQNSYTLTFDVTGIQDAPATIHNSVTTTKNNTYSFTGQEFPFYDVDGDTMKGIAITSLPTAGTLYLDGVEITSPQEITASDLNKLTWVPPTDGLGSSIGTLDFYVIDSAEEISNTQVLTFNVNKVNTGPVAVNDKATLEEGSALKLDVLANDTDSDDDFLSITNAVVTSGNGTVAIDNSNANTIPVNDMLQVRYTGPDLDPGEKAKITITYTISDGMAEDLGKLTVTVVGVAEPGDPIVGTVKADNLVGSNVGEMISGLAGKDIISGNGGNDRIFAGAGSDVVDGGAGNDRITGAGGNDTLTGGAGKDAFVFRLMNGSDTITDFTAGSDIIDLQAFDKFESFNSLKSHMTETGGDVVISLGKMMNITLEDTTIKELNADCFLF